MCTQVLIMLVCSLEVGKLLPVNHWSNSAGNRESSSALLTDSTCLPNPSSEHFRRNKRRMQPGWLDVACYTAACCWCVILYIHKRLFTRCHSLMSVSPQWGEARWHGVPEQLNSDTFQKHAHTTVELEWWREREKEMERSFVVKCKWKQSMCWLWALPSFIKIEWDRPHGEPFALPNYQL